MSNQDARNLNWHFDTELEDQNFEIRGKKLFFLVVFFCIIVITTALFLYTRWICRSRGILPSIFTQSHAPPPPQQQQQSQGLDAAAIKKLPIILHQAPPSMDPNGALECCICLGVFRDGEKLKVLPGCEHWFHCECVDMWLANHSSCPLCRASLKLDSSSSSSFPNVLIQEPPLRIDIQF